MEASLSLSVVVAAGAGLLSFLSPCVLPLVPSYLAYVAGISFGELQQRSGHSARATECVVACGLRPDDRMLDLATGTGPLLLRAVRELGPSGLAVGLDLCVDGLIDGQAEAAKRRVRTHWVQGRALSLPFRDGSFDAIVIGFALRHLGARHEVLRELRRVLVPGGRLGIVDFLRPWPGLMSWTGLALERAQPLCAGIVWLFTGSSSVLTALPP